MNKEMLLEAYSQMLRIRLIEERLVKEYLDKNIRSFVHFYIGQEAIAVGVCMNLATKDYAFGTHRCHGHYLAKGGDLKAMIAELYGKAMGCSGGRGGSMHLIDKSVGYMGSVSILASVAPIAVGSAFALKKAGNGNLAVVFVGDGAADEGGFYESLNLAALMKVPIIFILENNLYAGMSDAEARHPKFYDRQSIVRGLGAEYYKVDGNDVIDVWNAMQAAKESMPAVIECMTYRHMAHSAPLMDDNVGYRKVDDLKTRQKACPLRKLKNDIIKNASSDMLKHMAYPVIFMEMEQSINKEIDEAIRFAEESPMPDPETLTDGVYHE